jgi:hypothetical protein
MANTHGVPDAQLEMQRWFGQTETGFVVSGGLPATSATTTLAAFATIAYVQNNTQGLQYVDQAAASVGPLTGGNGVYWIAIDHDLSSAVSGWTRQVGTHYLWQKVTAQPANPVGALVLASATVSGGAITAIGDVRLPESVIDAGVYNVRDPLYGAIGDGITDDTDSLQDAVNALPSGGILLIPQGTYLHNLTIDFRVIAGRATLKMANSTATSQGGVEFLACTDGLIEGLQIDQNRANRTPIASSAALGITVLENSARLTFRDCRVINACLDGIYVSNNNPGSATNPQDITFENCSSYNSYRNNASLIAGNRITMRGGEFLSANGTAPEAGIDVEPDVGQTLTDVLLEGVICSDNTKMGIQVGGTAPTRVHLVDCYGSNNGDGLLNCGSGTNVRIKNLRGDTYSVAPTRAIVDFGASVVSAEVDGITIDGCTFSSSTKYLLYTHSSISEYISIKNLEFSNYKCPAMAVNTANASLSNMLFRQCPSGPTIQVFLSAAKITFRQATFRQCAGIQGYISGADCLMDGVSFVNPDASSTCFLWIDTGGNRAILRNIRHVQDSANTSANALFVTNSVPVAEITNFLTQCNSTGSWTTSNVIGANLASMATCKIEQMSPDAYQTTVSFDPGNMVSGADYVAAWTHQFAKLGDIVLVSTNVSLGTAVASGVLELSANVTSDGNGACFLTNNTPNAINPGAMVVAIRLRKR